MKMEDKPAMLDISSRIWEGSDYIPAVFDEWVTDREGEFAAVLLDGRLVGCGKLTFVTPADAWLEGLRKDPLASEKGLAETVARYFLARLARRPSISSVRFSTYIGNRISVRVNEKLGFRVRVALSVKEWEGKPADLPSLPIHEAEEARARVQIIHDGEAVVSFLEASGYPAATRDLTVEGWHVYPWSPGSFIERYVRPGRCRGIMSGGRLSALAVTAAGRYNRGAWMHVVAFDARDDRSARLLLDDVVLSARADLPALSGESCGIDWMVPRIPRLLKWAAELGLKSWEQEDDFLVYELPLELLASFA
jgi:hypothetical protein